MADHGQGELTPVVIDLEELKSGKLDEFSAMQGLASSIKLIMHQLFGGASGLGGIPVTIRGQRDDVRAFARTLGREKNYMKSYKKYGLNNPKTYKNKFKLNKSVRDFERKTGLKWPFK
jgi:hypothetical protein